MSKGSRWKPMRVARLRLRLRCQSWLSSKLADPTLPLASNLVWLKNDKNEETISIYDVCYQMAKLTFIQIGRLAQLPSLDFTTSSPPPANNNQLLKMEMKNKSHPANNNLEKMEIEIKKTSELIFSFISERICSIFF